MVSKAMLKNWLHSLETEGLSSQMRQTIIVYLPQMLTEWLVPATKYFNIQTEETDKVKIHILVL